MISYFVFLLLPQLYLLQLVKLPDTTQNGAKRFTLQDLLANQQLQQQQEQPKTQTVDLGTLIAAARNAAINQQQQTQTQEVLLPSQNLMQQFSPNPNNNKEIDIDVQPDKNGNINLDDLQGMLSSPSGSLSSPSGSLSSPSTNKNNAIEKTQISASTEGSMINDLIAQPQSSSLENHIVHEELDLGKQKIELEAAGKRTTHYTLARSKDGGLNLIPIVEGGSGKLEMLQSKGYEEQGKSRQQMQLTTLSQALYSPFPSDQNILHLHLKGKDGKDGKPGNKGPMGPMGPRGPEGSRGPKGDAGTCSSQINGLFECTPDELDSLSNRIDYLEKICKKVQQRATKKHNVLSNITDVSTPKGDSNKNKDSINASQRDQIKKKYIKPKVLPKEEVKTENIQKEEIKTEKKEVDAETSKADKTEKTKDVSVTKVTSDTKDSSVSKEPNISKDTSVSKDSKTSKEPNDTKDLLKKDKELNSDTLKSGQAKETNQSKEITDESDQKESVVNNKKEKTEKVRQEESSTNEDSVAVKKQLKKNGNEEAIKEPIEDARPMRVWHDPTTAALRSMVDIKAKLKMAELDLMDRVKEAKDLTSHL